MEVVAAPLRHPVSGRYPAKEVSGPLLSPREWSIPVLEGRGRRERRVQGLRFAGRVCGDDSGFVWHECYDI